ncbi:MAG: hypothetical protein HYR84_06205 [Planctomycetes bacterium]|nr:hypothetical protein [Planctomycetota bacterium]
MSKVILDADLKAKLGGLHEQIELCDTDGQTMGRYVPEDVYQKLLYQLAESQRPVLSAEETKCRRQVTGRKSLAEIMESLEAS